MKTTIEVLREIAEVLGKNDEVSDTIPDMSMSAPTYS